MKGPPVVGTPLLQPAIDLTRAQEIALEGQANAVVTDVDLNGDNGVLEYSVTLDNGKEVDLDAATGTMVKSEQVDNGNNEDNGENGNKR